MMTFAKGKAQLSNCLIDVLGGMPPAGASVFPVASWWILLSNGPRQRLRWRCQSAAAAASSNPTAVSHRVANIQYFSSFDFTPWSRAVLHNFITWWRRRLARMKSAMASEMFPSFSSKSALMLWRKCQVDAIVVILFEKETPGIGVDGFFQGGPVLDKVPESLVDRPPPKPQRLRVIGSFQLSNLSRLRASCKPAVSSG